MSDITLSSFRDSYAFDTCDCQLGCHVVNVTEQDNAFLHGGLHMTKLVVVLGHHAVCWHGVVNAIVVEPSATTQQSFWNKIICVVVPSATT